MTPKMFEESESPEAEVWRLFKQAGFLSPRLTPTETEKFIRFVTLARQGWKKISAKDVS
jgi:hypothetical protein